MNYTNSDTRIRSGSGGHQPSGDDAAVLSLERDSRGVHLRLRRISTLAKGKIRPLVTVAAMVVASCPLPP